MSIVNHRKVGAPEAQAVSSERNLRKLADGVIIDSVEPEKPSLPGNPEHYIPNIKGIVSDENILDAIWKVKTNKGSPGIDGITTDEIEVVMETEWPKIKQAILEGKYYPKPVKRVEIPKPDGKGVRQLGIPTVIDRIIQQAILQEISITFEVTFSEHSYGFRPYRKAHQAVQAAQKYIQEGHEWVVDIDLEKFFDRVNHDMLMARVARKIKDKKILLLIRRYLESGIMEEGLVSPSTEGTPQGGPLSPLLSNIMLDDFDKELEKRGHRFCRYADDCNIYVKSEKAGMRVMESAVKYLTKKLKLKVNQEKSAVDRPRNRKFLGFTFTDGKEPNRIKVHERRIKRFKDKVRGIIKKMKSMNLLFGIKEKLMPVIRGWTNYFGLAQARWDFNTLDGWIRRKIRQVIWRQWKTSTKRLKALMQLGATRREAANVAMSGKGPWRISRTPCLHKTLSNKHLEKMGLTSMKKILETAVKVA